ncbi:MAG: serine/threonine protein kinase [Myxococcales bacterium]|nr:serine/threonine protein kinase [Myxococcales bacterium]
MSASSERYAGAAHDAPPSAASPNRIGRYVVLRILGEGGMGVVYSAFDEELDRKVAIKLLREEQRRAGEGRTRLQREAQAMARLSHPNVVQVYDAGDYDGKVFLAMELVEGVSLREWLERAPPSWRERLDVCIQAGRGLAAAHAAGLIHRDFKPENVIVSPDGVPRVGDFGLARSHDAALEERPAQPGDDRELGESSALELRLTRAGTLVGTPAYMSPEQHLRQPASTLSDQFSFCVVTFEALFGERPFAGHDRAAITLNITQGRISTTRGVRVPARVRDALVRGLRADPEERWPSMDALLGALTGARARGRWPVWLTLGAMVSVFAGGYLFAVWPRGQVEPDRPVCSGAEAHLEGVWDDERRAAVERALLATGAASAADTALRVRAQLDRYREGWIAAHHRACEATHLRGEQSAAMLDLRMACLQRELHGLGALTSLLAEIDADGVTRAVQASLELAPLTRCEDLEALRSAAAAAPTPDDPAAVQQVRSRLSTVTARTQLGAFDAARALSRELVELARALSYAPLLAEVLLARADVEIALGDYEPARATVIEAYWLAERVRDDLQKLRALTLLIDVEAKLASFDAALEWSEGGRVIAARVGEDSLANAELLTNIGHVHWHRQEYETARGFHERALAIYRQQLGPEDIRLTRPLFHLGRVFHRLGQFDESRRLQERALAISEAALGPEHPRNAEFLNNLGNVAWDERRFEDARAIYERNIRIYERAFGSEHPQLAGALNNLGDVLSGMGQHVQARRYYERALKTYAATLGEDHPHRAFPLRGLGEVHLELGDHARARSYFEDALTLHESHPFPLRLIARTRFGLARVLWAEGEGEPRARALALARQAEDEYQRAGDVYAAEHAEVVTWLQARGDGR